MEKENINRVADWLAETNYEGVILGRRDNFKWATEENANAVVTNAETGVAFLIIERDGTVKMAADSSDCPRMEAEQNAIGARCILVPWYETTDRFLNRYCERKNYASDTGAWGTECVQDKFVEMRMRLNQKEVERYRRIGRECAEIVEDVTGNVLPGQTENEVAAILKSRCLAKGISPDCVLVGSDERIINFRHPVPTDKKIEGSAMVVLGGEKYGLNISMTRMVYFKEIPEEIKDRMKKTQYIFACMQGMMKEGLSYGEYFAEVQKLYDEAGWPEEWKQHHQGGPTGYGCREFIVTPETEGKIHEGQAYAWNPTIQGTKCEETTYLKEGKLEIFTCTENWPRTVVKTRYGEISVADILERQK